MRLCPGLCAKPASVPIMRPGRDCQVGLHSSSPPVSLSALSSLPSRPFPLWHIWKLQLIFDYGLVSIFCFKKTPKVNILPSLPLCVPFLACQLLGGARYLSTGVCGPFLSLLATIHSISLEDRRAHEIPAWPWRLKPLPGQNSWTPLSCLLVTLALAVVCHVTWGQADHFPK